MTEPNDDKQAEQVARKVEHDRVHGLITGSARKHAELHGNGMKADHAHLEEMLAHPDVPTFIKARMRMALNRHVMHERMQKHDSINPTGSR